MTGELKRNLTVLIADLRAKRALTNNMVHLRITTGPAAIHFAALHNAEPALVDALDRHRDALRALVEGVGSTVDRLPDELYKELEGPLVAAEALLAEWGLP